MCVKRQKPAPEQAKRFLNRRPKTPPPLLCISVLGSNQYPSALVLQPVGSLLERAIGWVVPVVPLEPASQVATKQVELMLMLMVRMFACCALQTKCWKAPSLSLHAGVSRAASLRSWGGEKAQSHHGTDMVARLGKKTPTYSVQY